MMVKLMIRLCKKNGIAKKIMHPNILLVFLLAIRVLVSSRAFVCIHAYSVVVSINVHLTVQLALFYAIAENKVFIWSFWVYCLKFSQFTSTLFVDNFTGMSFVF